MSPASTARAVLKRSAELVLARAALRLAPEKGRAVVLAYHNVLPQGAVPGADRSLHLPLRAFRAQLQRLARTHDVVPLAEALRPGSGRSGRPRVAITFDDAYRGAVTTGVEELARLGLPATIFVAPGCLGGQAFWWDSLHGPSGDGPASFREHALEALGGQSHRVLAWAERAGIAVELPQGAARSATEEELRRAVRTPGISLGSHTWDHPNLARIPAGEVREQLERPLRWLRAGFPDAVLPLISYPYGRASAAVAKAAAAAGYHGGLEVEGGPLPAGSRDPFGLPRLNVPAGMSPEGLLLRAAGLLGGR